MSDYSDSTRKTNLTFQNSNKMELYEEVKLLIIETTNDHDKTYNRKPNETCYDFYKDTLKLN